MTSPWNDTQFILASTLVIVLLVTLVIAVEGGVFGEFRFSKLGEQIKEQDQPQAFTQPQTQSEVSYIYANGQRIASVSGNEIKFYHSDYLGSSRIITDETGNKISSSDNYPFGSVLREEGSVGKYKFTGKELDSTGLAYFGARYHDSSIGRFTQIDPAGVGYAYANNNPFRFTDPTGMQNEELFGPPEPGQTWSEFRRGIKPDQFDLGEIRELSTWEYFKLFVTPKIPVVGLVFENPELGSVITDFIPVVGDVKGIGEAISGGDAITGKKLDPVTRGLCLLCMSEGKALTKTQEKLIKNLESVKRDTKRLGRFLENLQEKIPRLRVEKKGTDVKVFIDNVFKGKFSMGKGKGEIIVDQVKDVRELIKETKI